jgi:hypothetical protein
MVVVIYSLILKESGGGGPHTHTHLCLKYVCPFKGHHPIFSTEFSQRTKGKKGQQG